jgi:hypothetical protein
MARLCVALGWNLLDYCFLSRVFEAGTNKYQVTRSSSSYFVFQFELFPFFAKLSEFTPISNMNKMFCVLFGECFSPLKRLYV